MNGKLFDAIRGVDKEGGEFSRWAFAALFTFVGTIIGLKARGIELIPAGSNPWLRFGFVCLFAMLSITVSLFLWRVSTDGRFLAKTLRTSAMNTSADERMVLDKIAQHYDAKFSFEVWARIVTFATVAMVTACAVSDFPF